MPTYEYRCEVCGWTKEIRREKPEPPGEVYCENEWKVADLFPSECRAPMKRVYGDFQFKMEN